MIDAQVKPATCRVTCASEAGTGWLVTPNKVITARHCIGNAISRNAEIILRFEFDGVSEDIPATVLAEDESLDVCVLLLPREMELAPILLDEELPAEGSEWTAFGYPTVKLAVGHRLEGSISQILDAPKMSMDMDLHVGGPSTLTDYRGLSGAALICNDRCHGMLRLAVDKALGALSVARMAEFLRKHSIPLDEALEDDTNNLTLAARDAFTDQFEALAISRTGAYVFIEGAHGIGKSTFCQNFQPVASTLEHFGTYSFTPIGSTVNAMHLAQPEVFYDWLNTLVSTELTGKAGRTSEKRYSQLIAHVNELLQVLATSYSSRGRIGIIFVDGFDEVAKLGGETLTKFVGLLPARLPEGLVVVLSAPSYVNQAAALGTRIENGSTISMPSLTRDAERVYCASALMPERMTAVTVGIICDRAQGHPLYLRYLIDLANDGADDEKLSALPNIDGSIRNYYEALWPQLSSDSDAVNFLGIIARLRWGIPIEQLLEILTEVERAAFVTAFSRIQHLLLRRDETTIYHSSFSVFLAEKTSPREVDIQRRLTHYCVANSENRYGTLNVVYHALRAGATEEARAVSTCEQVWVDRCVTVGTEPDVLLRDIEEVLAAATRQGNPVEVVRILLLSQRLQFRYDTLFAQSAALAADALLALGKTQEAIQHVVRYGRMIVPLDEAFRLALQLILAKETDTALELLDKAETVINKQLTSEKLTLGNFVRLFDLRTQLLLLRRRAGDDSAMDTLMAFYGSAFETIRGNIKQKEARNEVMYQMTGCFGASTLFLIGRYSPVSEICKHLGQSPVGMEEILLRLIQNYGIYEKYYDAPRDRSALTPVFADLTTLLNESTDKNWEKPTLDVLDALITVGGSSTLLRALSGDEAGELNPVQLIKPDNISIDVGGLGSGLAQWRLATFLNPVLPCPPTVELHSGDWLEGIESIFRALAWCDGAARRAKQLNDEAGLQLAFSLLNERVLERLRFTLAQRVAWEESYAVPEAIFPLIYEQLVDLLLDVYPENLDSLLSVVETQFSDQCGLYSEGFRNSLSRILKSLSSHNLSTAVEDRGFALLQRWRDYVERNVKNRHELVPELLAIIPLFVRWKAPEEAHRIYQTVLAVSMGPSWYKEDQLSLMTGALGQIPHDEPLGTNMLSRIAGNLERASGEMTFQRFVRYDKAELLAVLCRRGDYLGAVRYFQRQTCGSPEQLLAEACDGEIDRPSALRGMRYPGGALDEQAAMHRILDSATSAAHWPICWALLEIFQYGDDRHLEASAKAYARLAIQMRTDNEAQSLMLERLSLICDSEFDETQRREFLKAFKDDLPLELLRPFETILKEVTSEQSPAPAGYARSVAVPSAIQDDDATAEQTDEKAVRDALVMPGMFGTVSSTDDSGAALARAEKHLARRNISAARDEALVALEHLQRGGWSIWGNHSPDATKAEDILRQEIDGVASLVRLYAPLILNERYIDKWRRADHLIERTAALLERDQLAAMVEVVLHHIDTLVGDTASQARDYEFLDETRTSDASSSLLQLFVALLDHPQWGRREKAAELMLWLMENNREYVSTLGPAAFTMDSGNHADALCGALDHLSLLNAVELWDCLAPAIDLQEIERNCRHVGRLSVLLRIAGRAAQKESSTARAFVGRLRSLIPSTPASTQGGQGAHTDCPAWARVAAREWRALEAMGVGMPELAERATVILQDSCAPLPTTTRAELEDLLAEGFREQPNHSLGRWMAKVRHALQVALLPIASEELLPRLEQVFRTYNPTRMSRLRVMGFSPPTIKWIAALTNRGSPMQPTSSSDIYLDFQARVWDDGRWRMLRITAFFYNTNSAPVPPANPALFISTSEPTSSHTSKWETCARVAARSAFFGSFTPAIPSHALMQMTSASGSDLTRAHWRKGRAPINQGSVPMHEGCFLAIKKSALRLPKGISVAWQYEIDGRRSGILSYASQTN